MNPSLPLLLAAIAAVESGNNDFAVGAAGEVSRYQIMPAVWKKYAFFTERNYTNPAVAKSVALVHINALKRELPEKKRTAYGLVVAWNLGSTKYRKYMKANLPIPASVVDYASRVLHTYEYLTNEQNSPLQRNPVSTIRTLDSSGHGKPTR